MQNAPKMTTESITTVINWKHKWVKKKKLWLYRLQMVANIMIARRKDGMVQKMLAEKTTVHVK